MAPQSRMARKSRMSPRAGAHRAFGHPTKSHRAQMTPEPTTLLRMAYEIAACPLSYGRIADLAGGWLMRHSGESICGLGPFRANPPKPTKPSQSLLLVLVLRLLLYYCSSCC